MRDATRPPRTRTLDVRVRLSADEKRAVQAIARAARLTVSDLIRERLGLVPLVATAPDAPGSRLTPSHP
jgi:hypothetical protein